MRDNWCIGWSARYVVGVWVGNASGAPMHAVSGVTGAAPVWLALMRRLHRDQPSLPPTPPAGLESGQVAFVAAVEPARREWFHAGTAPRATRALASPAGTIVAPVTGTVVALDPDVPADRQRVPLVAQVHDPHARFVLDGDDLGPAANLVLWPPRPGRHELVLIDATARPLAHTTFDVRGTQARTGEGNRGSAAVHGGP
jgi:penicillin-binding protein 1C